MSRISWSAVFAFLCSLDLNQRAVLGIENKYLNRPFHRLVMQNNVKLFEQGLVPVFLQIGAHVGFEDNDPLYKPLMRIFKKSAENKIPWKWILVEPVPSNFEVLKENFAKMKFPGQGEIILENMAIAPNIVDDSKLPFYSIENIDPTTGRDEITNAKFPKWVTQIGSFKSEQVYGAQKLWRKRGLNIEDYVKVINVNVNTIDSVLSHNNLEFKQVSVLLMDTEGFDCILMKSLDFTKVRPAVIIFEYKHCKRKEIRWVHHKLNKLYIYHRLDEENEIAFLKLK